MLVHAIVIAGDGPSADVHLTAYRAVADVAQVVYLAANVDAAVLDFDEVADMRFFHQFGARAQAGEGADAAAVANLGAIDVGIRRDLHAIADHRIADHAISA